MGLPDDTQTISSQSSQSSNEQEVSIWVDEMEDQQQKRKSLNEAVGSISSGRFSPGTIYERLLRQLVPRFPLSVLDKKTRYGALYVKPQFC